MKNAGGNAAKLPFLLPVLAVFLGGCSSLVEGGGRLLEGSALAEKTLARYRTAPGEEPAVEVREVRGKDGKIRLAILPGALPALVLKGSAPEGNGEFYLDSLYFLCSNPTGWNELTRELSGGGFFLRSGRRGVLRLEDSLEVLDITGGKIRRKSARLIAGEALQALRNRDERIRALCGWMLHREGPGGFGSRRAFEGYWKPILFPELARRKPPAWAEQAPVWTAGGGLRWNEAYTAACFPEELRDIRNSGALLRDWEEAAGWIYLEYYWDAILGALGKEIQLTRIK